MIDDTVIAAQSSPQPQHTTNRTRQHNTTNKLPVIFISNLNTTDTKATRSQLRTLLQPYGLKKLVLPCNHYGHIRGYAFATLSSQQHYTAAIAQLHNTVTINNHPLYVTPVTSKVDIIYPLLTYELRLQVQLDSYAIIGTTDQLTAQRITTLLYNITHCIKSSAPHINVLDCTACIGTQAIALAEKFDHVTAIELDAHRHGMLQHNTRLLNTRNNITTIHGSSLDHIMHSGAAVICVDPMWQAASESYADHSLIGVHDMKLGDVSIADLCVQCRQHSRSSVICIGLPYNYDTTELARLCVAPFHNASHNGDMHNSALDERPMPFRLEFGKRTLFVLCLPTINEYDNSVIRQLDYGNNTLDNVIQQMCQFNVLHKLDHKPSFYDWEKRGWISCMRWRGNTQVKAVKQTVSL